MALAPATVTPVSPGPECGPGYFSKTLVNADSGYSLGGYSLSPVYAASGSGGVVNGTSGTLKDVAPIGALLIDQTVKAGYINVNTVASPTWAQLLTARSGLAYGLPTAVTAGTTQTLAGATALSPCSIVNAANANDGVYLPAASGSGAVYLVITVGSTATPKVWPQAADKIDAASTAAAVTLTAANRAALFVDVAANQWRSFLLGAVAS